MSKDSYTPILSSQAPASKNLQGKDQGVNICDQPLVFVSMLRILTLQSNIGKQVWNDSSFYTEPDCHVLNMVVIEVLTC